MRRFSGRERTRTSLHRSMGEARLPTAWARWVGLLAAWTAAACGGSGSSHDGAGYGHCVSAAGDCACAAIPQAPTDSCHVQDVGPAGFCVERSGSCECMGIDCYSATSGSCQCGLIPIEDAMTTKGVSIGPSCQGKFCCLEGTGCECGPSPCSLGMTVASCETSQMESAFAMARAGTQGRVVAACDGTAL
jgi:hypothetical protein